MLVLLVMVFKKRLPHLLVWLTCDSAEEKNVAAQPPPPTNQVQTCIFQIPLGEMIHVCKNPRVGGGGHLQMQKDKITKESFNI